MTLHMAFLEGRLDILNRVERQQFPFQIADKCTKNVLTLPVATVRSNGWHMPVSAFHFFSAFVCFHLQYNLTKLFILEYNRSHKGSHPWEWFDKILPQPVQTIFHL